MCMFICARDKGDNYDINPTLLILFGERSNRQQTRDTPVIQRPPGLHRVAR